MNLPESGGWQQAAARTAAAAAEVREREGK